jgi:hypothetical protein
VTPKLLRQQTGGQKSNIFNRDDDAKCIIEASFLQLFPSADTSPPPQALFPVLIKPRRDSKITPTFSRDRALHYLI